MQKIYRHIVCVIILLIALCPAVFSDSSAGQESLFIFGAGARPLGMGGTFTAVADDGSAAYFNPAGLAFLEYRELTLFNSSLYENTNYLYGSFSYPILGLGTASVSGIRLGTDDIVFRDRLGELSRNDFSYGQYWVSYGIKINSFIAVGANLKFLNQSLGELSTSTGSFDLGLLAHYKNTLFIGANAQDLISGEMKLGSEGESLPYNVKGGMAIKFRISEDKLGIILASDLDKTEKVETKYHFGAEFDYENTFFLRGGYDRSEITFGAGIRYKLAEFDYAYKGHSDLDATHRMGVSLFFGPSISKQKQRREEKLREEEQRRSEIARQQQINSLMSKADNFYEAENWDSAAFYYNQVIAYDPENVTAVSRFREISDRVDNLTREEIDLRAGQIAFQQLLDKSLRVADSLFIQQKYESALIEYNKIIELDSANQHALQRLNEIQEYYDNQFDQYVNDGESLLQQERYADAVLAFTEAQRIKPENTYIAGRISFAKQKLLLSQKLNDAVEYINTGDTARAQQLFIEVLQIDSTETIALDYLERLEQVERARPVTLEELKADEEIWNIYLDGLRFFGEGRYREAIEKWQIVLDKYPGSIDTKENLRQAELRLQQENR